jgi:nicotinamidase-related amidase
MPIVVRLARERATLVVVDLQTKLVPAVVEHERLVKNGVLLLRLARVLQLPVVLTTQYSKGLGPALPEVLAEAPGVVPVDKASFSCFGDQGFLDRLRSLAGRGQLLVAGVESHICVAQTVLGALAAGYQVHVASDAVSSRSTDNHRVGLARMERAGALLSSTEMAAYELLERSDVEAFKKMLPYFKA